MNPITLWRAWLDGWFTLARAALDLPQAALRQVTGRAQATGTIRLESAGTAVSPEERRRQGWRPSTTTADLTAPARAKTMARDRAQTVTRQPGMAKAAALSRPQQVAAPAAPRRRGLPPKSGQAKTAPEPRWRGRKPNG